MKKIRALFYVDDDIDDLELFHEISDSLGIETLLFDCADKLFDTLLHPPPKPSVIFVDLNMPKISGFQVLEQIKNNTSLAKIPTIAFSTTKDLNTIERCRKLGADYYITKPSQINQFKNVLKHVVSINWKEHDRVKNFCYHF